jgi:predicted transposase/invertase (TIGR01784 family)
MLAVDGRIDSTDYQVFEKIYTNQMAVRDMFATAISEKDKRLIQEGEVKGKAQGQKEEKMHIAKQMKTDGINSEVISKYTGLSEEEIAAL